MYQMGIKYKRLLIISAFLTALCLDWEYAMRRDMQEVIPGLYLGPYAVAMKSRLEYLQNHSITHIICIRQDLEANFIRPCFPDLFRYLVLNIKDCSTENIIRFFPQVKTFIDACFSEGGRALIHGNAGISRSAALVIAYLMEKFGLTYKAALEYVQKKRFCVSLNEGFSQQLMEYEPIYQARLTLQNGQSSQITGLLKRKHCEEDAESDYANEHSNKLMDVVDEIS